MNTDPLGDTLDLALAALLVVLNGGLSLLHGAQAGNCAGIWPSPRLRMVVQLSFGRPGPGDPSFRPGLACSGPRSWPHSPCCCSPGARCMARQERRLSRSSGPTASAPPRMLIAASLVTGFGLERLQISGPDPWYHPRYALPLLGMVLGNTMTGISAGPAHARHRARDAGARRRRGAPRPRRHAARGRLSPGHPGGPDERRFMPIVNAMAATGLVALPGMMTGQIIAGADPQQAVRYQILVMFLIAGGTGLGATMAVLCGTLRLSDSRHRLRLDRLSSPED